MNRNIGRQRLAFGCHPLTMGEVVGGGRKELVQHALPAVKKALELGITTFNTANSFYGATGRLAKCLVLCKRERSDLTVQTQLGWYYGFGNGSGVAQSTSTLSGVPYGYESLVPKFAVSPDALENQLALEQLENGGTFSGVALHNVPDMKGLTSDQLRLAVSTLNQFRLDNRFTRLGIGVRCIAHAMEFLKQFPGVLDYVGVTSSPVVLSKLLQLLQLADSQKSERKFQVSLLGIFFSGAFTLTEDPATAPPFSFNHGIATDAERQQMSAIYQVCQKSQYSLKELAAASTGILMVNFPSITQCVISSIRPTAFEETVEMIDTAKIPPSVFAELKAMEVIPRGFPKS